MNTQQASKPLAASPKSLFLAVAAILVFALAFGGGGSKYGFANLLVQIAALVALSFHRQAFFEFWKTAPITLRCLVGLSVLLPALYLVPLPPSIWAGLPGRDLVFQSLELVNGAEGGQVWSTLSVDPIRTLLALTAVIAPLALLTIGWSAPRDRLITIGWIAVGFGLINFLIGIPQVLTNSEMGVLYPENPMPGVLFGTFANRNSTGLFLVAALSLASFLPAPLQWARKAVVIRVLICALLVVAIVLTRSRTALVLALLPLGLAALRIVLAKLGARDGASDRRSPWVIVVPAVLAVAVIGAVLAASPGRFGMVLDRFNEGPADARVYIWDDGAYAVDRYWPIGSGTGTFDEVFQIDESLENMTARRAGRAHNDYIEVAIETGVLGLGLIAGWLALLTWLSWKARNSHDRWIAWSGSLVLGAVALQSITDYPLRNQSLLVLASFALLVLIRFGAGRKTAAKEDQT